ncbi:MAG: hypothetical protein HOA84_06055 [Candidatus Jacksonbacteria bacterium]|jgi:hypothetical protein|nr:hypothetical protein [Candidatus Jacksonbacteria bacterium]
MKQATRFIVCASLVMITTLAGCRERRSYSRKDAHLGVEIVRHEGQEEGEIHNLKGRFIRIETARNENEPSNEEPTGIVSFQTKYCVIRDGQEFIIFVENSHSDTGWLRAGTIRAPERTREFEVQK